MNTNDNRPIPTSYWVVPAQFLAGEYPGHRDETLARSRLTAFLNAGFDAFFDLTAEGELPPYLPVLLEGAQDHQREVRYQRFAIRDRGLPRLEDMRTLLNAIDQALADGHKIYLHCWGGIGRTGTAIGCFLVRHGLNQEQALTRLADLYQTAEQSRVFPVSPETAEQRDFIRRWSG
ncbi:MAG: dual specificity protein phosphatase family protein [Anaerolineales bacterium]|nr:dual specificity protein phosphatase family protein [Anaerolineales bacterium]